MDDTVKVDETFFRRLFPTGMLSRYQQKVIKNLLILNECNPLALEDDRLPKETVNNRKFLKETLVDWFNESQENGWLTADECQDLKWDVIGNI